MTDEQFAHDGYHHKDGTVCIWDGTQWFEPYDAGGEGVPCEKRHESVVACTIKEEIYKPTEAQIFRYGKLVFDGVDKSVLLKEKHTTTAEALMSKHWLIMEYDAYLERFVVTGCHCGFQADVDQDSGWGDSVVKHLLEVGASG